MAVFSIDFLKFSFDQHTLYHYLLKYDPDFHIADIDPPLHRIHTWIDPTNGHLFFVCRGTQSKRDWQHPDRQINAGIGFVSDRIDAIRDALRDAYRDLGHFISKKGNSFGYSREAYTLYTIGHSLGGFLANAAAVLTYNVSCSTNRSSNNENTPSQKILLSSPNP